MKKLLPLIRAAFADTQRPARPLTTHRCSECNEADSILSARTWQEVAADFPPYCYDAYPLLTDSAKAYFLPAYLIVAMRESCGLAAASMESEVVCGRLQPAQFSRAQRLAVLAWATTYWRRDKGVDPPTDVVERWRPPAL